MTLDELRQQIDVLDEQLVTLINERATVARQIGMIKAASALPVYEPTREKIVYAHVCSKNRGPLPDSELTRIYERILDVMRTLQKTEPAEKKDAPADSGHTTSATAQETGNKQ